MCKWLFLLGLFFQACIVTQTTQSEVDMLTSMPTSIEIDPHHGLVWMPISWSLIQAGQQLTPSFTLKDPLLVFEDTQTQREIYHKLWVPHSQPESSQVSTTDAYLVFQSSQKEHSVVSSFFLKFPPGTYRLKSLRVHYLDRTQKHTVIDFPIPSPFDQGQDPPFRITSLSGKVGIVGRLIFQTHIHIQARGLSTSSRVLQLDQGHISADLLTYFTNHKWKENQLYDATGGKNQIIFSLDQVDAENWLPMGLKLIYDCSNQPFEVSVLFSGKQQKRWLKWTKTIQKDDRVPQLRCESFLKFYLPEGSWRLEGVAIESEEMQKHAPKKNERLPIPLNDFVKKFLKTDFLSSFKPFQWSQAPWFSLSPQLLSSPVDLMYLGTIVIKEGVAGIPSRLVFQKSFSLLNLQTGFQAENLINPYSGVHLKRSKRKDILKIELQQPHTSPPSQGILMTALNEMFSPEILSCIRKMEEKDPFLVLDMTLPLVIYGNKVRLVKTGITTQRSKGWSHFVSCVDERFLNLSLKEIKADNWHLNMKIHFE